MTFVAVETQPHVSMQRLARQTNATPRLLHCQAVRARSEAAAKLIRVKKKTKTKQKQEI